MADSVVRLRIDSQEYDAKLKRAGDALSRYFETVRKGGGTLEYLDDGVMDAVKALGEMETQANSAKGKMREYTEAITSLTAQYRQMSDAEKNGAIGKELKRSLDELKKKAADLNDVMGDTNTEIRNLASDTAFSDGMSLMARSVGNVGTAIVALTGDSEDMKRVLMDIAKIQSTVQAIDSLTKAFQKQNLVLLKNPYVLVASAIAAMGVAIYECVSKTDEETSALRDMNKELDATASKADIASKSLQGIVQATIMKNYVSDAESEFNKNLATYIEGEAKTSAAWEAYNKADPGAEKVKLGVIWRRLQKETDNASAAMRKYQDRIKTFNDDFINKMTSPLSGTSGAGRGRGSSGGGRDESGNVAPEVEKELTIQQQISALEQEALSATQERRSEIAKLIKDLDAQLAKQKDLIDSLHNPKNPFAPGDPTKMGFQALPLEGAAVSAFEKMQSDIREQFRQLDLTTLTSLVKVTMENDINDFDVDFSALREKIGHGLDIPDEKFQELQNKINEQLQAMGLEPINIDFKTGKLGEEVAKTANGTTKAWQAAANAVSQFGSALKQVEDPSAKIAGIIGQAVANIALGFAQAAASPATGAAGVFGWIAAATAGLSTMAATIATIKKTTAGSFANGGVIPGNSYSGDNQWAQVNAGEVILSRAQAGSVASQLESSEGSSQPHNSYISGEQIVTVVNAYGRRTGRGEILN